MANGLNSLILAGEVFQFFQAALSLGRPTDLLSNLLSDYDVRIGVLM